MKFHKSIFVASTLVLGISLFGCSSDEVQTIKESSIKEQEKQSEKDNSLDHQKEFVQNGNKQVKSSGRNDGLPPRNGEVIYETK
jgi:hypothetical protein